MRIRDRSSGGSISGYGSCPANMVSPGGSLTRWPVADKGGAIYDPYTTEHTEDVVTPGFSRLSAQGTIVNNSFLHKTITNYYPGAVAFRHRTTNSSGAGYDWTGTYVPYSDTGGLPPHLELSDIPGWAELKQDVIDLAVTGAHASIDESEMLIGASAYEARETVEFCANLLRRSYGIFKAVRKADLRRLRNEISRSELEDRYMEYRYALRPMYYDAAGLVSALQKERGLFRRTYRSTKSGEIEHNDTLYGTSIFYETLADLKRTVRYTVSARAGVLCDVRIDALTPWGADKLPETLWEIIPFSFVADWFVNIGDTIAAHTPNSGVRELASWVTVKQTFTATNSLVSVRSTAPTDPWNNENFSTCSGFEYGHKELVLERFPNPSVRVFPQSKLRLDSWKLLDLGIMIRKLMFSKS